HLQAQGHDVFNNPAVQQRLKLTGVQHDQVRQFGAQYDQNLRDASRRFTTDPQGTAKRYEELRRQHQGQIESTLSPQQLQLWREIIGEPYSFPLDPGRSK